MKALMVLRKQKFQKLRSSGRAIINHLPTFFFVPQVEKVKRGEVGWVEGFPQSLINMVNFFKVKWVK
jgi:hypothetical protein